MYSAAAMLPPMDLDRSQEPARLRWSPRRRRHRGPALVAKEVTIGAGRAREVHHTFHWRRVNTSIEAAGGLAGRASSES